VRRLLNAYPRWWRDRYGDELLALLEAEPVTVRVRANVVVAGLRERARGPRAAHLRVLWAWSFFVIGGMAFQKASEHWQVVVPSGDRDVPTASFDVVQAAAVVGSTAVLVGVALSLPAFLRDLREGGWTVIRSPIVFASGTSILAAASLVAVALAHDVFAASAFIVFVALSLFAWTHAASVAASRLAPRSTHSYLALLVTATMFVIAIAAGVWVASVTSHAPSFLGVAQLAVIATFMLAGAALAASATASPLRV
jgi:hypothetical protein